MDLSCSIANPYLQNKKDLVDSKLMTARESIPAKTISKTRQCKLLNINRNSYYYKAKPISQEDIKILHTMDEIYTDNSDWGYRFIYQQLIEDGYNIGINRVLKYIGILGVQAIYPTKKKLTSIKNSEHKISISSKRVLDNSR